MRQGPSKDPNEGCLPGSVGAEITEGASTRHPELDPVDGGVRAEPLGQTVGLDGPVRICLVA